MTQEEYTDTIQAQRDKVRKAKASLVLHLARDMEGNKKGSASLSQTKGRLGKMWGHC